MKSLIFLYNSVKKNIFILIQVKFYHHNFIISNWYIFFSLLYLLQLDFEQLLCLNMERVSLTFIFKLIFNY
jgi:hypothetical protein